MGGDGLGRTHNPPVVGSSPTRPTSGFTRRPSQQRLDPRPQLIRHDPRWLAGDTDRLARLTAGQADTLLHMLAYPEAIPGARLDEELGVPRAAADVLIGKATNLDLPLTWAAFCNRVEYVRLLLGAGAGAGTRTRGTTPLENAIYSGSTQVVDLLAEHGIVPQALWTYAACGRLDLVRACFDADGRLRPDAASSRPHPADILVGFRPGSRRPTIRRRSSPRRSSTPASTAGPRSCAGSLTSASAPTSRPTSGGPACTGRSRTLISR
jgi:hypothetical protein